MQIEIRKKKEKRRYKLVATPFLRISEAVDIRVNSRPNNIRIVLTTVPSSFVPKAAQTEQHHLQQPAVLPPKCVHLLRLYGEVFSTDPAASWQQ